MTLASDTQKRWPWPLILAFAVLYISWGTTYLALRKGVLAVPPFLFSGPRLALAGLVILGFLVWRGESLRLSRREFFFLLITSCFYFVGGNGLLALALVYVTSGLTAVITSPTPLFVVLLELFIPWGDRLTWRGWLGLLIGFLGVVILSLPKLSGDQADLQLGVCFALGSTLSWAIGSLWTRHAPREGSPFRTAGYQLLIGGVGLTLLGLAVNEGQQFTWSAWTPEVWFWFFYLLVFGSLLGFVAFTYVLRHTSTALAGTYAYVNPLVALLMGACFDQETLNLTTLGCVVLILSGVALVKIGGVKMRVVEETSIPGDVRVNLARPGVEPARK